MYTHYMIEFFLDNKLIEALKCFYALLKHVKVLMCLQFKGNLFSTIRNFFDMNFRLCICNIICQAESDVYVNSEGFILFVST